VERVAVVVSAVDVDAVIAVIAREAVEAAAMTAVTEHRARRFAWSPSWGRSRRR
jgi:hypothetical protein